MDKKRILKLIGNIFMVVSVLYVIKVILGMDVDWKSIFRNRSSLLILMGCGLLALIQCLFSNCSWMFLLRLTSGQKVSFMPAWNVYSKSNLAKYLPGNVMHFVGRNLLGEQLGIQQMDIALSTVLELLLQLAVSCGMAIILSLKNVMELVHIILRNRSYCIALICLCVVGITILCTGALFLRNRPQIWKPYRRLFSKQTLFALLKVICIDACSFGILGMNNLVIIRAVLGADIEPKMYLTIIALTIISWLAGFVIPGAPGGIGIREAVSIWLMSPILGSEVTAMAAVLQRIVSITGDLLLFGSNVLWRNVARLRKQKTKDTEEFL